MIEISMLHETRNFSISKLCQPSCLLRMLLLSSNMKSIIERYNKHKDDNQPFMSHASEVKVYS